MSSSPSPFVSIIVPTFRRPRVLRETLEALLELDYPRDRHEIIVIDDGSGDETPIVVAGLQKGAPRLIYHGQLNRGVATARNQGVRLAHGELLIFVDDDIVVQPTLIQMHLETMAEFGDCLVNGHWEFAPELAASLRETPFGRYRIELEQWIKDRLAKSPLRNGCVEPEAMTACNLSMRREHFERLGGFDEQFPFAGYEDQDLSLRAEALGYQFVYNPAIQFWHNDHRLTLRQFCERQRRGAITAALLALKYPEKFAGNSMIVENSGMQRGDRPALVLKKLIKQGLATKTSLHVLHCISSALERVAPRSRGLLRLYWMMCGLYIFCGIREGLSRYGQDGQAFPQFKKETM